MLLKILSLLVFVVQAQATTPASWEHLKNEAVDIGIQFKNNSYTELIGSPEFLTRAIFIPYSYENKPVPTRVELKFATYMPKTVRVGATYRFSDYIPMRHVFENLDMSQVAYFVVHYKIVEDDFFLKQTVVNFKVTLTPFGFSTNGKADKKEVLARKVKLNTAVNKSIEAIAKFESNVSLSAYAKARKDGEEALAFVQGLIAEAKNIK